jgi:hypothetical protein
MTHYLRFPSQSTGMAALAAAGFITTDESGASVVITASHTHALDVIGTITTGGQYNATTGAVITPPTTLAGWHVNYIGALPAGWDQHTVTVRTPYRVFAGTLAQAV